MRLSQAFTHEKPVLQKNNGMNSWVMTVVAEVSKAKRLKRLERLKDSGMGMNIKVTAAGLAGMNFSSRSKKSKPQGRSKESKP